MTEGSIITDELRKMIGKTIEPVILKVEEGAIQRYAQAIGDPNPLYNDVGYARKSKYGRLLCPPGFFGWPVREGVDILSLTRSVIEAGAPPRVLDGGIEYQFLGPIGAGDILTSTTKIAAITEKDSKSGMMLITTVETTYLNQDGDIVVKAQGSVINR